MSQGGSVQLEGFLVLLLKITPFVFSSTLYSLEISYHDRWYDLWDQYRGAAELWGDWTKKSWRFQNLSQYLHDKSTVQSSLQVSLVYLIALHLLLVAQEGVLLLLVPSVVFLFFALLTERVVNAFYRLNSDGRNPNRYENYYYDRTGISDDELDAYKNWFLPQFLDQRLSPPHSYIIIDMLIIIDVSLLEIVLALYPDQISSIVPFLNPAYLSTSISLLTSVLIIIVSWLVFPFSFNLPSIFDRNDE